MYSVIAHLHCCVAVIFAFRNGDNINADSYRVTVVFGIVYAEIACFVFVEQQVIFCNVVVCVNVNKVAFVSRSDNVFSVT